MIKLSVPIYYNIFSNEIKKEWNRSKSFVFICALVLIISYSLLGSLELSLIKKLGREDGLFEFLTAVLLFTTSVQFLTLSLIRKNIVFSFLALVFFFGFGEEVSWGQRLINFEAPAYMKEINRQGELSIHNLPFFQGVDAEGIRLKGIAVFMNLNFVWKIFCLSFGIILPLLYIFLNSVRSVVKKLDVPTTPITIGVFFGLNYFIYFVLKFYFIQNDVFPFYERPLQEISEFYSSFIFIVISTYFIRFDNSQEKQKLIIT